MKKIRADRVGEHRTAFDKNKQVILNTQSICGICGKPVDKNIKYPDPLSAAIDHIIPISKGGHPSAMENLQLAHRWCNRQKSDKVQDYKIKFQEQNLEETNNELPLSFDWKKYKAN